MDVQYTYLSSSKFEVPNHLDPTHLFTHYFTLLLKSSFLPMLASSLSSFESATLVFFTFSL